ncbi:MAG: pyruvate ferredoxin oxidoreductase subunit gamma [Candidatus Aenigmarchaeota archaeon]|nr:pyruvate ferredoxin oxidoreductase subunit gamma [Candidatus Aenigmarchaeota archaeon]NIQ18074.1 pyruvate ferredoxin oxidoreductase subunit gamma [Candidatus Aenigmarchaeota archaeon]
MLEIVIHGRGGQGAVTAAELLAIAAFKDGKFTQAFPKFGPERRGSPVQSYCRISKDFITLRTQVYSPDHVIVLDDSLPRTVDITKGLSKKGIILINSERKVKFNGFDVYTVDANKIAMEVLGRPIVNTVMLGAFAKATGLISLENLVESIKERFEGELRKKNVRAVKRAYEETVM